MTDPSIRRRHLLRLALGAGAGALLPTRVLWAQDAEKTDSDGAKPGPVLVVVFLRGGVDGLSMLVPHADSRYYELRSSTRLPARGDDDAALDLDGHFGMHPAMASLRPLYREHRLAWVHAIGSPSETRSHFEAQDFMELGACDALSVRGGWLARYLESMPQKGSLFGAISTSETLPLCLWPSSDALTLDVRRTGRPGPSKANPYQEALRLGRRQLFSEGNRIASNARRHIEAAAYIRQLALDSSRAAYPRTHFGEELSLVAGLIKQRVGVRVAWVDKGGWDTHVRQGAASGLLSDNLRDLSDGLAAFARDLGEELGRVIVLGLTEFGRTAAENGTGGTDHGHGSASFVLGGPVAGGKVLGRWPGLRKESLYEERDLAVTTDYRQLLSEIMTGHMGARDARSLFPGYEPSPTPLGVLAKG